jgi:D-sedoheptulose 7-phosphate isomerase
MIIQNESNDLLPRISVLLQESIEVKQRVLAQSCPTIAAMAQAMALALHRGKKILLCGNGGSAADAQHLAGEFLVRLRSDRDRRALPAIALHTDTSTLTACANDYGYQEVFARLVEGLGMPGDVLIALSASGQSVNVIRALEVAWQKEITTVGLLGGDGGAAQAKCDLALIVPSTNPGRVQEVHITVGHILVELVEETLFGSMN